ARQQFDYLVIREMVQEQRAENVVETARGKWQREGVAHHSRTGAAGKMRLNVIETRNLRQRPPLPQTASHIARSRADIQYGDRLARRDRVVHQLTQGAVAAPVFVDADE